MKTVEGDNVHLKIREDNRFIYTKYVTRKGTLTQAEKKNLCGTNKFRVGYFLKRLEDFDVLKYVLENQSFEFDRETYKTMGQLLDDRCEPMINVSHGSIQKLFIEYIGLERGVTALWKHRDKVEELLTAFDQNDDKKFDVIKKPLIK
ncbi:MAG: hypothetical protein ACUVQ8_02275 [Nitrososphaeria archaeon]